ncbi:flagellar biosynthesis protein FlhF [Brevibacillus ginsengisoli]|uniref:flagellar biosynthesis protein FlhF n=1 Tax=Brevibacillus ginsengisoli TaxID=363854 RepID=UPI003CF80EA8
MRVKRYVVDSMPDALEKIRVDLGKDAIILNTKSIKTGGFLGFFGKQQIEVIAATEEKGQAEREKKAATSTTERPKPMVSAQSAKQAYQRQAPEAPSKSTVEPVEKYEKLEPKPIESNGTTKQSGLSAEQLSKQNDTTNLPALNDSSVKIQANQPAAKQTFEKTIQIADELRDMRQMFEKLLIKSDSDQYLPDSFTKIRSHLISQEIEPEIVSSIISSLIKRWDQPHTYTEEEVRQATREVIIETLSTETSCSAKISKNVKHVYFFGPTGVGKTTTIAKLAAECMLKEKRKVGFITSDTYRIAAVDQLRTYANILNVPLEVVFSPKEISQAMDRLSDCDLILIDTAGRNYRNDEYVNGMKELLRYGEMSENYLVLSLSSKYADMKSIVSNFSDVPSAKVIFTKADETKSYGSILNIISQFHFSLSYITTGQNVPDDIVIATPEMVAKMVLGEESYGA